MGAHFQVRCKAALMITGCSGIIASVLWGLLVSLPWHSVSMVHRAVLPCVQNDAFEGSLRHTVESQLDWQLEGMSPRHWLLLRFQGIYSFFGKAGSLFRSLEVQGTSVLRNSSLRVCQCVPSPHLKLLGRKVRSHIGGISPPENTQALELSLPTLSQCLCVELPSAQICPVIFRHSRLAMPSSLSSGSAQWFRYDGPSVVTLRVKSPHIVSFECLCNYAPIRAKWGYNMAPRFCVPVSLKCVPFGPTAHSDVLIYCRAICAWWQSRWIAPLSRASSKPCPTGLSAKESPLWFEFLWPILQTLRSLHRGQTL